MPYLVESERHVTGYTHGLILKFGSDGSGSIYGRIRPFADPDPDPDSCGALVCSLPWRNSTKLQLVVGETSKRDQLFLHGGMGQELVLISLH